MKALLQVLKAAKEYWFLITVVGSALASIAYMIIFQVNPWDKQREIKNRRNLVSFHNLAGYSFLEGGQFKLANAEFEAALNLEATDRRALNGRYLSGLFLALDTPDWDASAGVGVHTQLTKLVKQQGLDHIVEKYLGDLHYWTNQNDKARGHYETALQLKPRYPDALNTLGWFHYLTEFDLDRMESYFKTLTDTSPYDYRGFHGLGYSLYIRALGEREADRRQQLLTAAAAQSNRGKDLSVNRWSIIADFGEVARSVDPNLSIFFHRYGNELMEDPELEKVNPRVLGAKLLMSEGEVRIKTPDAKRAWITYQLALDHLAMYRLRLDPGGEESHNILFAKASSFDATKEVYPIYADQLAILDFLLPTTADQAKATPPLHQIASASGGETPT